MAFVRQSSTVEPFPGVGELNGLELCDSAGLSRQCDVYFKRQNSVNEEREHDHLMSGSVSVSSTVDLKNAPKCTTIGQNFAKNHMELKVSVPVTEENDKDEVNYKQIISEKATSSCSTERVAVSQRSPDVESGKEKETGPCSSKRTCFLVLLGVLLGCLLTCGVLIPIHLLLMRQRDSVSEPPPLYLESHSDEWPTVIQLSRPAGDTRPLGKFLLDQETLSETRKLLWKASSETKNSTIIASEDESCVVVPESGFYCVLSQVTFAFTGSTKAQQVGHNLMTVHEGRTDLVQKKLITVPFRDTSLPPAQKVLEPSNLLTYVYVEAGDKICVNVAPTELLYVAPLDNVLIVVKQ